MPNKLKLTGKLKRTGYEDVDFEPIEIEIVPNVDTDVELELVYLEGGPVLRPKNPPQ